MHGSILRERWQLLVTGARTRNIGKAIADALAANGARVAYADIDASGAEAAAKPYRLALGMACSTLATKCRRQSAIGRVVGELGRLDVLVNNAGINTMAHRVTVERFPRSEWDRILAVDLTGSFLMSRPAGKVMVEQGSGRIINIASVAGLVPLRLQCAFVAAKAGLVNLTKAMALELGPRGVLVNGIAPGSILTEGTKQLFYAPDGQFHANMQRMLDHVPLGRPGTSEEIAHAALFLAAPESSYINGHILTVDGGWTAGYARDF